MKTAGLSGNDRIASFLTDFFFKVYQIDDQEKKIRYLRDNSHQVLREILSFVGSEPVIFECFQDVCFVQNIKTDFMAFLSGSLA